MLMMFVQSHFQRARHQAASSSLSSSSNSQNHNHHHHHQSSSNSNNHHHHHQQQQHNNNSSHHPANHTHQNHYNQSHNYSSKRDQIDTANGRTARQYRARISSASSAANSRELIIQPPDKKQHQQHQHNHQQQHQPDNRTREPKATVVANGCLQTHSPLVAKCGTSDQKSANNKLDATRISERLRNLDSERNCDIIQDLPTFGANTEARLRSRSFSSFDELKVGSEIGGRKGYDREHLLTNQLVSISQLVAIQNETNAGYCWCQQMSHQYYDTNSIVTQQEQPQSSLSDDRNRIGACGQHIRPPPLDIPRSPSVNVQQDLKEANSCKLNKLEAANDLAAGNQIAWHQWLVGRSLELLDSLYSRLSIPFNPEHLSSTKIDSHTQGSENKLQAVNRTGGNNYHQYQNNHKNYLLESRRRFEFVSAFCKNFILYQLETWRLLINQTTIGGDIPLSAGSNHVHLKQLGRQPSLNLEDQELTQAVGQHHRANNHFVGGYLDEIANMQMTRYTEVKALQPCNQRFHSHPLPNTAGDGQSVVYNDNSGPFTADTNHPGATRVYADDSGVRLQQTDCCSHFSANNSNCAPMLLANNYSYPLTKDKYIANMKSSPATRPTPGSPIPSPLHHRQHHQHFHNHNHNHHQQQQQRQQQRQIPRHLQLQLRHTIDGAPIDHQPEQDRDHYHSNDQWQPKHGLAKSTQAQVSGKCAVSSPTLYDEVRQAEWRTQQVHMGHQHNPTGQRMAHSGQAANNQHHQHHDYRLLSNQRSSMQHSSYLVKQLPQYDTIDGMVSGAYGEYNQINDQYNNYYQQTQPHNQHMGHTQAPRQNTYHMGDLRGQVIKPPVAMGSDCELYTKSSNNNNRSATYDKLEASQRGHYIHFTKVGSPQNRGRSLNKCDGYNNVDKRCIVNKREHKTDALINKTLASGVGDSKPDRERQQPKQPKSDTNSDSANETSHVTTPASNKKGSNNLLLAKVSLAGAKRRLGFKQKGGLNSLNVHRSEEILPPEVIQQLSFRSMIATTTTRPDSSANGSSSDEPPPMLGLQWLKPNDYSTIRHVDHDSKVCFVDGLGAGQIASRQALVSPYLGDIQLSLSDQRGMLEVEVVRVRQLQAKPCAKRLPSPYVKVYLMRHKKCIAKFKTTQMRQTLDPLFQQRFIFRDDYRDCVLQVIVWGDYGKKDRKSLMGLAQIHLNDLDISGVVVGWYKLFNAPSLASASSFNMSSSKLLRQTISSAKLCEESSMECPGSLRDNANNSDAIWDDDEGLQMTRLDNSTAHDRVNEDG